MNNFNEVFVAVKRHCNEANLDAGEEFFHKIAEDANIPPNQLDRYLNAFQDLGLIRYSRMNKFLFLTSLGKTKERLFV